MYISTNTFQYAHLDKCTSFSNNDRSSFLNIKIDTADAHSYLSDHQFGGKCFVPGTMIIEIMFEAAFWHKEVVLGLNFQPAIEMRNIRFDRAISIEPGARMEIQVNYLEVKNGKDCLEYLINISSRRYDTLGKAIGNRVNASCEISLTQQGNPQSIPDMTSVEYESFKIDKKDYYQTFFPSLGYYFNSCSGNIKLNRENTILIGEYDCENKEKDYIAKTKYGYITSPLGNDSCLQYAVFLSRIIMQIGRLPVSGENLRILSKHPDLGKVKAYVSCKSIDEDVMLFDFMSFTGSEEQPLPIVIGENFRVRKSPFHELVTKGFINNFLNKYKQ